MLSFKKNNDYSAPTDAVVAVTYKCNSKCVMCNIWKTAPENELSPKDFSKLPGSLKDINITGGEPFLRTDLIEIAGEITSINPKVRLVFSTNGFLTDRIVDYMKQIRKINPRSCVGISLDGIDDMHSEIRGINNAYNMALNTIKELKKARINDIRVGFTASKQNAHHLAKVYDLTQALDIEFTLSIAHNSEGYFSIDTNITPDANSLEKDINYVIDKELKYTNPRRLFRVYFIKGILDYVRTGRRPMNCYALKDFFFMDSTGNIYPCNVLNTSIGNITKNDFDEIWQSGKIRKLRYYCENCDKCWMVCTAKSSIRRQPFKVSREIIPSKIKSMGAAIVS